MLKINDRIIDQPILDILKTIQTTTHYLKEIKPQGINALVTCPFHADGDESHPSCGVVIDNHSEKSGVYHCFACGERGSLDKLVAKCFNLVIEDARQWLVENYSNIFVERQLDLLPIDFNKENIHYLSEETLDKYAFYHPYMFQRGLTEDVILKFRIGYNKENDSITFPVWDENNRLVGITERSVRTKYFYIPEHMGKPVYLLNYVLQHNITEVVVCESQLDALKCWTWGIPAIALFGTGSKKQYNILNKTGIRFYHLALDGDLTGELGAKKFIKNIRKDVFIDIIKMPNGKDVNDLTKEEFLSLQRV